MKKIEAIIRSSKFDDVKDALAEQEIDFFTFMEVKGYGKQRGEHVVYRGAAYDVGYIARLKLDIYTVDEKVDDIVKTILGSAKTGEIGDGKVIITNIDEMWSVRLGTKNESAL